jgi:CRISPR-associated protein Csb3
MMSLTADPNISVRVDPKNPGQFFACCGLLELADRMYGGAEGWFDAEARNFLLRSTRTEERIAGATLGTKIINCLLKNTMTECQIARRNELGSISKKDRVKLAKVEVEKKMLDSLWREAPIVLPRPFNLRVDWFIDARAGGATFKTWAGQQSVYQILFSIQSALREGAWASSDPESWLTRRSDAECLPFNFDSDLAGVGSDLDLGFSLDPLKSSKASQIRLQTRPMIEFLSFVGLQRFRPLEVDTDQQRFRRRYRFGLWSKPLVPEVAAALAGCVAGSADLRVFEFRLLYRTDYLKSFLRAVPRGEK